METGWSMYFLGLLPKEGFLKNNLIELKLKYIMKGGLTCRE